MNIEDFDTLYSDDIITEISLKITADDIRDAYQSSYSLDTGSSGKSLTEEQISRVLSGLLRGYKTRNMPVVDWTFIGQTAKRVASN